jgi:tetratricopeptide (TPR) repeat protein
MNPGLDRHDWLEPFRQASDSQPIPPDGHCVEDDEFLACWTQNLLSPREHQDLVDHLAICPHCRREVAEMTRAGVLVWQSDQATVARPARRPRRLWHWCVLSAAALLLVSATIYWWASPVDHQRAELAFRAAKAPRAIGALVTYDYELTGQSPSMSIKEADPGLEGRLKLHAARNPHDLVAQLELGYYYLEQDMLTEAKPQFEYVRDKNPRSVLALLGLGMAEFIQADRLQSEEKWADAQRKLEAAEAAFRDALTLAPDDPDAQLNWGILQQYLGNSGEATRMFEQVYPRTTDPKIREKLEAWLRRPGTAPPAAGE